MDDDERLVRIWNISLALEEIAKEQALPAVFEFAVAIKFLANMPDHWVANNMQKFDEMDKEARELTGRCTSSASACNTSEKGRNDGT